MEVLTVIKAMLTRAPAFNLVLKGGVWNNQAVQNDELPNVVLMLMGGGDEWTHQGPTGLFRQTARVIFRGRTDQEASDLAKAGFRALNNQTGLFDGMIVQQCRRTQSSSDYNEAAQIQRQIDSYMVTWRYSPEP